MSYESDGLCCLTATAQRCFHALFILVEAPIWLPAARHELLFCQHSIKRRHVPREGMFNHQTLGQAVRSAHVMRGCLGRHMQQSKGVEVVCSKDDTACYILN